MIEIPQYTDFSDDPGGKRWDTANSPAWLQPQRTDGEKLKPIIRCNCGQWVGIGLHHVHADGTVTASFFHSKGTNFAIGEDPNGCGWHVFVKLIGWAGGDFPAGVEI
jgi:hypothetical protein